MRAGYFFLIRFLFMASDLVAALLRFYLLKFASGPGGDGAFYWFLFYQADGFRRFLGLVESKLSQGKGREPDQKGQWQDEFLEFEFSGSTSAHGKTSQQQQKRGSGSFNRQPKWLLKP